MIVYTRNTLDRSVLTISATIFTPITCAWGKVSSSVVIIIIVVVHTKSPELGVLVSAQCYEDVTTSKKSDEVWLKSTN